jgi:stage V sporulation protein B
MAVGAYLAGVSGTILGFVLSALVIVPLAVTRSGIGRTGEAGPAVGAYLKFLGPVAVAQAFLNLLMQTDFFLLSGFLGRAAEASGLTPSAADRLVGAYRAAQLFAFLPYQLLMSITFVLFPMLARADAEGDRPAVARYTATGVRIALIMTGMMCGTISALAPHVVRFAFPADVAADAGGALRVLALGMGAFSLLGTISAALTSLKRERVAATLTAGTAAAIAAGCFVLVPSSAFGPAMLVSSATATSIALVGAACVGAVLLRSVAGAFVGPATIVRVVLALAVTVVVGMRVPWLGKLAVLPEALAMAILFLGVLVVSGELGRKDLTTIRSALGRRS